MTMHRFLLVKLGDIGDLILTTPAISALREAHPEAQIDLFTSRHAIPIMPSNLVDEIIPFEKGDMSGTRAFLSTLNFRRVLSFGSKYDTVIFFHHFTFKAGVPKFHVISQVSGAKQIVGLKNDNISFLTDSIPDAGFGAKHEAQYWLDLVSLVGADASPRPSQVHTEDYVDSISFQTRPFAVNQTVPKVVIHAGSGGYNTARRWIPERFAEVANQLKAESNAEIIFVGKLEDDSDEVADMMHFEPTDLVGKTTLPQLADIIQHADLFIGADSGVMHIASATGTPVISIFGPSNYRAWHPWAVGGRASVLTSQAACSPCSYVGHGIGTREGCEARTCMKMITSQRVLNAATRILDNQPKKREEAPQEINVTAQMVAVPRSKVLGVPVDAITYIQWMKQIHEWVRQSQHAHHVCTVNPEFMMVAQEDPIFFHILQRADLCVPDGVGLLWATRHLGNPVPERVTGSDGVPLIAQYAAKHGWKLFFLGAGAGIAEKAANIMRKQHPNLEIVGTYAGSPAGYEEDGIVKMINHSGADILFVAFGAPEQDKWIARNLPRLEVKMAMGVGGAFDFIAGVVPRAPEWMQKNGLEWLYRLIRQPWRLKRMLRLPRFVLAVLRRGEK